ncbi:MAG: GNAT family N-acetyltransferase [Flavobacteriales bacterium]|nr:GNAT family N-acetyltransferase [Flavobacteriales bacterium]
MQRVRQALNEADLDMARQVLAGFPAHQRAHYTDHLHIVDRYFDDGAYAEELNDLGRIYGPPRGLVLIGFVAEQVAGAVCLREIDRDGCEMKRLFVSRDHRRRGLARELCEVLLEKARALGYRRMVLDTGTFMVESQALYRDLGFRYIGPYQPVPEALRDGLVYMEKVL